MTAETCERCASEGQDGPSVGHCHLCHEDVFSHDLMGHIRVMHPDVYVDGPMRWPDGEVVIDQSEVLEPDEFC